MHLSVYRNPASLPTSFDQTLDRLREHSLFASRGWLENYADSGICAGDRLRDRILRLLP